MASRARRAFDQKAPRLGGISRALTFRPPLRRLGHLSPARGIRDSALGAFAAFLRWA